QKALRSMEIERLGLIDDGVTSPANIFKQVMDARRAAGDKRPMAREDGWDLELITRKLTVPNAERIFFLADAFRAGMSVEQVFELTKIDRWFLQNMEEIVQASTNRSPSLLD